MTIDPATLYKNLRASTREMLGLSEEQSAEPARSLQIDLIGILRLEIDALSAASLAGQPTDVGRLGDAVKLLKQLLPAASNADAVPDFAGARWQLENLLRSRSDNLARGHEREIADVKAEIAALKSLPAPRSADGNVVPIKRDRAAPAEPEQPKPPSAHSQWVKSSFSPYGGGGSEFDAIGGLTSRIPPGSRRDY